MEDIVYYNELYDLYGELLTDKQREYFEDYYFNNLSLTEISENENVSRNAVHKQLKEVNSKLYDLERKLKINEKNNELLKLSVSNEIKVKIEKIINLNN